MEAKYSILKCELRCSIEIIKCPFRIYAEKLMVVDRSGECGPGI